MKEIKPGPGFTLFLLFFSLALLDAVQEQNWRKATMWLLIGLAFLLADKQGNQKKVE